MTCPSILPESDTFGIRFASLVREAQSKHNAPFVGFSRPGAAPVVVSRRLLKASIAGMTDAQVRVMTRAGQNLYDKTSFCNEVTGLEIRSLDGSRRYVLYSKHAEIRTYRSDQWREVRKFAARKSSSLAAKNGWVRVVRFDEETGERSESHEKAGLTIKGAVVWHSASGKSIAHADNRARAFMLAMLGPAGIAECRRIEREVAA